MTRQVGGRSSRDLEATGDCCRRRRRELCRGGDAAEMGDVYGKGALCIKKHALGLCKPSQASIHCDRLKAWRGRAARKPLPYEYVSY